MSIKVTLLFQQTTAASDANFPLHRIAGWSESWYFPGTNMQTAIAATNGPWTTFPFIPMAQARAAMLPIGGAIVGQRFQVVDPPGLSQSLSQSWPGSFGLSAGVPAAALLIRFPGVGTRNVKRYLLRDMPAACITEGEYKSQGGFNQSVINFVVVLNAAWSFRGRDLTQVLQPILSVSAAGVITTLNAPNVVVGNYIRVLKSKDSTGNLRGGRFAVTAVTQAPNTVTIAGWPYTATTGGNLRVDAVAYSTPDATQYTIGRIVTKKPGRPFVGFRGRRSRRR